MHIVATNICVWLKTLIYESLKEVTLYHQKNSTKVEGSVMLESLRQHTLENAGVLLGMETGPRPTRDTEWEPLQVNRNLNGASSEEVNMLQKMIKTTTEYVLESNTASTPRSFDTTTIKASPRKIFDSILNVLSTTASTTTSTTTTTTTTTTPIPTTEATTTTEFAPTLKSTFGTMWEAITTTLASSTSSTLKPFVELSEDDTYLQYRKNDNNSLDQSFETLESLFPEALTAVASGAQNATSCGRVNIMGTIVQDSAPYLYPFIIEYSLIGAVVIYVMWRHIGRYQK